jgi:hypothetical protein
MNINIKTSDDPVNKLQILIGVVFLFIGGLVYLIDRSPDLTYFVYRYGLILSLHNILPKIFGPFGNSLPDFIHVFSFILITAGIASCGKRGCFIISFSWLIIDWAFELGQGYSSLTLRIIPDWFSGIPILEAVEGYFRMGTFDFNDMIALLLGASAAYLVLLSMIKRRNKDYEK